MKLLKLQKKNLALKLNSLTRYLKQPLCQLKYDNIVLTHVLEHIDNPVAVLKRINDEWLSDNGRFFLSLP
jgi:2-polyprenyl-3-methyl-5-hydroxy-6-metoxy-1,4-benzoquinol methylase